MLKKIYHHIPYYIFLLAILLFGFLLVYFSSGNKALQIVAVLVTTIFYVGWGILHHMINHDLSSKIVVEYVFIGSLGLAVTFFILNGGI